MYIAPSRRASIVRVVCCCVLLSATTEVARAEAPSLAYFFPMGGRRGETVKFKVGGHYLHGKCRLEGSANGATFSREIVETPTAWFEGPLIRQPLSQQKEDYPRDYAAEATIAADAPLGPRPLRCWTSQGITSPLSFMIGDQPEITEDEASADEATAVTLPVTINGRVFPREDRDRWTFSLAAGQTVSAQAFASRLGLEWRPRLTLTGPDGSIKLDAGPGAFGDPDLKFTAAEAGIYALSIQDSNFGGLQHYVYRLVVTTSESVDAIYPLSCPSVGDCLLELVSVSPDKSQFRSVPLSTKCFLGAGATWGFEARIGDGPGRWASVLIDDSPEVREAEPNDEHATNDANARGVAGESGSNVVFHGRIQQPGDLDRWTFTAKKGSPLPLDLQAAALGSPLDAVLTVFDAEGKELARSDDRADGQPDPYLAFQAPHDGAFVAEVRSRFAAVGDATYAYRLKIGAPPAVPFRLTVALDALPVARGGEFKLPVKIERAAGYDEPIELTLEGLPAGLTAAPVVAAKGAREASIVVAAAADAPVQATRVSLQGVMKHAEKNGAGETIETAITRAAESLPPKTTTPLPLDLWATAVVPTPFKLVGEYVFNYGPRGGVVRKPFHIERGGYTGTLEVRLSDRQTRHLQGVAGPTLTLPPGESDFAYPVTLPPWMELGRTSRSCLGVWGVIEDADGTRHVVSTQSHAQNDQIIVIVDPEVVKLRLEPESIALRPGESAEVQVAVERPANAGAVKIELAPGVRAASAAPVVISPQQGSGKLVISLAPGAKAEATVLIRATTTQNGDPLLGESSLDVAPLDD